MGLWHEVADAARTRLRHVPGPPGTLAPPIWRSFTLEASRGVLDAWQIDTAVWHKSYLGHLSEKAAWERFVRLRTEMWEKVDINDIPDLTKCKLTPQSLRRVQTKAKELAKKIKQKEKAHKLYLKRKKERETRRRANVRKLPAKRKYNRTIKGLFRRCKEKRNWRISFKDFEGLLLGLPVLPDGTRMYSHPGFKIIRKRIREALTVDNIYFSYGGEIFFSRYTPSISV